MSGRAVDLNADVGEGGAHDEALLAIVTSANVACGGHAGDAAEMAHLARLCAARGVALGAHPGLPDRAGMGRRETAIAPADAERLVRDQLEALREAARPAGLRVRHLKAHGALYNMAARDRALADALVRATLAAGDHLVLLGLAGSAMQPAAAAAGVPFAAEVFADRTYRSDGTLTPRAEPGAFVTDAGDAAGRVVRMVVEGRVRATDGTDLAVAADTVCLHGDGDDPVGFAHAIRAALEAAGVTVRAPR